MFEPWKWIGPVKIVRVVEEGNVFCPVQARDVDVEGCLRCTFLGDVVESEEGLASAIECRPALRTLMHADAP
jgi:hypothetical protein